MTVISNVKGTLANLKVIQSELSHLAQVTTDEETSRIFHESMQEMDNIIHDVNKRIEVMKAEELQYRNS
ncbi:MAG TPA: DUF1657 domain-containing protein [Bacillaceae bacterium]|nr:DUF1657 domain-containing protein [Bacillaceae bacterium]